MNQRIREFERESGLEIFGLGAKRVPWEAAMTKFAELVVKECVDINKEELSFTAFEKLLNRYQEHFDIVESQGWVCLKCGVDRTRAVCPLGHTAAIEGRCPMTAEAQ